MQTEVRPVLVQEPVREVGPALPRRRRRVPAAVVEFVLFFAAAALRFLYYGFRYFPQLDDYIQYDKYANFAPLGEMIERLGLLASRPLAGVADIAIWSHFWGGGMIAAVLLLAGLWTASALLFRRVFDRSFGCGGLFCVLYLLLPVTFEGTYWMSAATRVVCGMFFCALSLWLFLRWIERGRWLALVGFAGCQLLAFGFYEQTLALAGGAALGLMLVYLPVRRRALGGLLTLVNLGAYFLFTGCNSTGALAGRMVFVWPWEAGYFTDFLPTLLGQMRDAFFGGGWYTLSRGFVRGVKQIADDGGWWYLLLFALLALGIGCYCLTPAGSNGRAVRRIGPGWAAFAFALICIAAPLSPFLIVSNPWLSLRSTVPALAGIALLGELGLRALFGRFARGARTVSAIGAAVLVLVCGVASVAELHDYRATYENDTAVLDTLAAELDGAEGRIGILNLNPSYLDEQSYAYHEHIHGITESYWAIQGALWSRVEAVPDVYPLATDSSPYYAAWNRDLKRIGSFDALYWWDNDTATLTPLTAAGTDETGWTLTAPDGTVMARVWEHDGAGYLE